MSGKHKHKYTISVAADDADEAIAVAAEGLPQGATLVSGDAVPGSDDMVWSVTLVFTGGDRRTNDPSA